MKPTTCTIPYATGGTCGAPAVATFGEYAECAAHHIAAVEKAATALIVGAYATLLIHSKHKVVKVLAVYRTRAKVEVPTLHGPVTRLVPLAELGL